jgi:iron complex transport system substrate-binding protein
MRVRLPLLSILPALVLVLIASGACQQPATPSNPAPAQSAQSVAKEAPAQALKCDAGPAATVPPLTPFPRTLTDALGNRLAIPSPPQRIISQTLGTDEILFAICPPSRIVGVSTLARDETYSNVLDQARASKAEPSTGAEQVLRLKPDLIFVSSYSRADIVEVLRASHAPIFRFANYDRIDDMKANIRIVGRAIGEDDAADRLIADMDRRLAALKARIPPGAKPPRVMSYSGDGYTAGAQTLFDDVIKAAGGVNVVAEHLCGFGKVSAEQLLQWDPEVIVTGFRPGQEQAVRDALLRNPVVAQTRAGKTGRIVMIPARIFEAASQHVVDGAEILSAALWPSSGS